jgi:hypothetical protein
VLSPTTVPLKAQALVRLNNDSLDFVIRFIRKHLIVAPWTMVLFLVHAHNESPPGMQLTTGAIEPPYMLAL